ncbi:Uncharacterised protein [Nocardia brasiliensis]|nr:Uncharacterised protein [Nocardia brasiliensis]
MANLRQRSPHAGLVLSDGSTAIAHGWCQRERPSPAGPHTMGLPVLLMPGAPSGLQKAPGVTPALGAGASAVGAGSGRGAGAGAGSSGAGTGAAVDGTDGAKGWIATGVVGAGVAGISVGSELVAGVGAGLGMGFVIVVAGVVLGSEFVCVPGSTESAFGATTPIMMSNRKDIAKTHPAVLRLRMRAQPQSTTHQSATITDSAGTTAYPSACARRCTNALTENRPAATAGPEPVRLCHHGSAGRGGGLGGPGGRGGCAGFAVGGDQEGEDREPGEEEGARAAE